MEISSENCRKVGDKQEDIMIVYVVKALLNVYLAGILITTELHCHKHINYLIVLLFEVRNHYLPGR